MKDETRIRGAAGRKVLADPRTHRYYLCLNDGENEKFISMFEQSGMKNKAEFIFARIFGWEFKVVKIDKEAQEYYAQLTAFYQQFRRIGNNYNQCVKLLFHRINQYSYWGVTLLMITTSLLCTNQLKRVIDSTMW